MCVRLSYAEKKAAKNWDRKSRGKYRRLLVEVFLVSKIMHSPILAVIKRYTFKGEIFEYILYDINFKALLSTDFIFTAIKDLNLFKKRIKN